MANDEFRKKTLYTACRYNTESMDSLSWVLSCLFHLSSETESKSPPPSSKELQG